MKFTETAIPRILQVMIYIGRSTDAREIHERGISLRYPVERIQFYLDQMSKKKLVKLHKKTLKYGLSSKLKRALRNEN